MLEQLDQIPRRKTREHLCIARFTGEEDRIKNMLAARKSLALATQQRELAQPTPHPRQRSHQHQVDMLNCRGVIQQHQLAQALQHASSPTTAARQRAPQPQQHTTPCPPPVPNTNPGILDVTKEIAPALCGPDHQVVIASLYFQSFPRAMHNLQVLYMAYKYYCRDRARTAEAAGNIIVAGPLNLIKRALDYRYDRITAFSATLKRMADYKTNDILLKKLMDSTSEEERYHHQSTANAEFHVHYHAHEHFRRTIYNAKARAHILAGSDRVQEAFNALPPLPPYILDQVLEKPGGKVHTYNTNHRSEEDTPTVPYPEVPTVANVNSNNAGQEAPPVTNNPAQHVPIPVVDAQDTQQQQGQNIASVNTPPTPICIQIRPGPPARLPPQPSRTPASAFHVPATQNALLAPDLNVSSPQQQHDVNASYDPDVGSDPGDDISINTDSELVDDPDTPQGSSPLPSFNELATSTSQQSSSATPHLPLPPTSARKRHSNEMENIAARLKAYVQQSGVSQDDPEPL